MKNNNSGTKKNTCPMCRHYDAPGFVINAHQVIACWECNPGNKQGLERPTVVHEVRRHGNVHPVFSAIMSDFGMGAK